MENCCNENMEMEQDMDLELSAQVDEMAPYFDWTVCVNWTFKEISSQDYEWKWVVLFFYPADFTFVCPTELVELADKYAELQKMWVEVIWVSTDTHFSHFAWTQSSPAMKKVKYPLLGDASGETCMSFWVYQENWLAKRWTFIIDPDWILRSTEISSEWLWRSSDELVRRIKWLQKMRDNPGQVCPNNWEKEWTLTPWEDLVWKI